MQDTRPQPNPATATPTTGADCGAAFLARWRHALREPLHALLAAAQVLESADPGSEVAREARGVIARQARNLAWVVSELPGEMPEAPPRR